MHKIKKYGKVKHIKSYFEGEHIMYDGNWWTLDEKSTEIKKRTTEKRVKPHGRKPQDLTGKTFGRLKVLKRCGYKVYGKRKKITFLCECSCGNKVEVTSDHLRNGSVRSCGCLKKESRSAFLKNQMKKKIREGVQKELKEGSIITFKFFKWTIFVKRN